MTRPPDLLARRGDVLDLMRRAPAGLFADVDGTLAPIRDDPSLAAVDDGARQALGRLAVRMRVVALTGRSAADARRMVGLESVAYCGNHGAEWIEYGLRRIEESAAPYAPRVREIARRAERELAGEGILVEDKGLTFSVHYRMAPDPQAARRRILDFMRRAAAGMRVRDGKMNVEARPPVPLSKGHALRSDARRHGLAAVLAVGDDVTDVDAFRAVAELRRAGEAEGASVAVLGADAPPGLAEAADYAVRDTDDVRDFLLWLADALEAES